MPLKAYLKFGSIYIYIYSHFIFYHLDSFISLRFFIIWTISFHCYFLWSGQFHFTAILYHLDSFISLRFFIIWTVSFHCYFLSSGQFHFTAFCKTFSFFSLFFFLPPFFCLHYSLWCCLATSVGPQKGDGGVYAQRAKTYRIGSIRWFEFPNAGEGTSMMAQRSWSFRSVLAR